jgi:integrating conjugative element protein (TIGR03749 family)
MKTTATSMLQSLALFAGLVGVTVHAQEGATTPNPAVLGAVPSPAVGVPASASPPAASAAGGKPLLGVAAPELPSGLGFDNAPIPDSERLVYQRVPLKVGLVVNRERLIGFPAIVALRAPEGFEALAQTQIIDRTVYIKALAPFNAIRVIAEEIHSGRKIPIDLTAEDVKATSAAQPKPLEVVVVGTNTTGPQPGQTVPAPDNRPTAAREAAPAALDMVALTRHAAQSLYAPTRLAPQSPGIAQVSVSATPVQGLYRGWRIETTPIGSWRSGQLTVTAVRFRNRAANAQDLDLQEIRGSWLAATAQHQRLLGADTPWDTTVVYLVCDKPNFEACR